MHNPNLKEKRYGTINFDYSDGYLKDDFNKLKGDIKTLEQLDFMFSYNDASIEKIKYPSNRTGKYQFNKEGQIEFKSDYGKEFIPRFERWYLDYASGLIQKQIEHTKSGKKIIEYSFDEHKIQISEKKDSIVTEYNIKNDNDSLIVDSKFEERKYFQNLLISRLLKGNRIKTVYSYHSNANIKVIKSFDKENRLRSEKVFNDKKDQLSETVISYRYQERLKNVEVLAFRTIYEYDLKPINKSLFQKIEFPVNESKIILTNGLTITSGGQNYKYDKQKNLIEIHDGNIISTFEYEYDSKNNWIKRIAFYNKKAINETIRNIEYY